MERLQKVLASKGVASRRAAEELISAGRVTVNGITAAVGQSVRVEDRIEVDGEPIADRARALYVALNKPRGAVSSTRSTHGESTVLDLMSIPERLYPVGRLDKDTSGLLLLTNDGTWADLVMHPRYRIEKEYDALIRGIPTAEALQHLRIGVDLPDGTRTAPALVERRGGLYGNSRLSVTVMEGKKRQIRLMAAAVGHPVIDLRRVRVGDIELGELAPGAWRMLTPQEVDSIRARARQGDRGRPPDAAPRRDRRPSIRR